MKSKLWLRGVGIALGLGAMQASAVTEDGVMLGLTSDRHVYQEVAGDGGAMVGGESETTMRIGIPWDSTKFIPCAVFRLPYLGAIANPFTGATFSVGLVTAGQWSTYGGFKADLYGLGVRATPEITGNDFYIGASDPTDATKVQDNWLDFDVDPVIATGVKSLSSQALTDYLNTQYAGGTNAGKYIVLRISMDASGNPWKDYLFASADNATEADRPVINYTAGRNFVSGETYADSADANVYADITSTPTIGGGNVSGGSDTTHLLPMISWSPADTLFNTVYPFQLPDFGAVDNPFLRVDFRMTTLNQGNGWKYYGIDLYGLPARDTSTVLGSDFFAGAIADKPAQDTAIQSYFLYSGDSPPAIGDHHTDATGDSNLRNYLNAQYAGGSGAGKFVFLRLNINQQFTSDYTGFSTAASEYPGTDSDPLLTYVAHTVDPPPSTTLMIIR